MSFTIRHQPPKPLCLELMTGDCKLTTIFMASDIKRTAVATREHAAAFVSFQWQQANLPPTQNVDSAPRSLTSARHFSGNNAICAEIAATIATTATS